MIWAHALCMWRLAAITTWYQWILDQLIANVQTHVLACSSSGMSSYLRSAWVYAICKLLPCLEEWNQQFPQKQKWDKYIFGRVDSSAVQIWDPQTLAARLQPATASGIEVQRLFLFFPRSESLMRALHGKYLQVGNIAFWCAVCLFVSGRAWNFCFQRFRSVRAVDASVYFRNARTCAWNVQHLSMTKVDNKSSIIYMTAHDIWQNKIKYDFWAE